MKIGKYEAMSETKPVSLKSYYISLISMVVCCAMFMSTTFAWFSSSVTSSGNEISIGSMQVSMFHHVDGQQIPVNASHQIFDGNVEWEPNHTEVEILTIANTGDLGLRYQLQFVLNSANSVFTNGLGMNEVAQWFEVYCFNGSESDVTNDLTDPRWVKVQDQNGSSVNLAQILSGGIPVASGTLEETNDAVTVIIALHLREDASAELMGQKLSLDVKLTANQLSYIVYTDAANATDLTGALKRGENVKLLADISAPAATTAPYGNYYGFALNGGVFNGNGKTLSVTGSGDTYAIMTTGGTIKNLTIDCGFKAIMLMYAQEDLILENVVLAGAGVGYPINTGEHGVAVKLIATDSTFQGWSSFAGLSSASFTNCSFGMGSYWGGSVNDRVVKPYVSSTFTNCDFVEDSYLDLSALADGCTVTLENCTVNGTVITAENWNDLFNTIELPAGRTLEQCVIFQ